MNNSILVVDDIEGVRRELSFLLEDENFIVHQARNGNEAIKVLTEQDINLVITDILMPDMDGFELCNYLSKNFPALLIIVISGGGTIYSRTKSDIDGLLNQAKKLTKADVVLKKPFSTEELLAKIKVLLN